MNIKNIKDFIRIFRDKYWIRKDREDLFWSGFMLACMVSSIVTTYWHYFDMIELRPKIKLKTTESKKDIIKKIKDVDFMVPLKKSSTFYKIEEYFKPE
ncbi:MAG: hypothetical protein N2Z20_05425 [Elusimicrobiales bacterium]|nr:hypothetical protein [Elusimicrobiales bacterium]